MAGTKGSGRPKKIEEPHENLERWLLTYADMITLLMLFFIVLYSMSTVNPAKYKDLAQALETIFAGGRPEIFSSDSMAAGMGIMANPGQFPVRKSRGGKMEDVLKQAISALQPDIQSRRARVVMNQMGVVINLASDLYFEPGAASILRENVPTLQRISSVLKSISNDIRIEGHTDNRNINSTNEIANSAGIPLLSNWELSAQRAINVLKFMESFGVESKRLSAVARSDTHPLESNNTPEERAYNRRVDILIVQEQ
jgi:chemotaxis protein MotB